MKNLLYLTSSWPLTWSIDFWPQNRFLTPKFLTPKLTLLTKLVLDLNFGSTQLTRYPYARWLPINLANFKQLYLENGLTYETETSTKLKILMSFFYWCVKRWPLTFEIWHMTNLFYLISSWPLTWSIDFRPQIKPTFQVWPKLNIYVDFYKQNTFGHFHPNFIEIGARP